MKNKWMLAALTITIAMVISIAMGEWIASLWLASGSTASACPNWDTSGFENSQTFSATHAHYEPMSVVKHCQPEYNYEYHINRSGFRDHKYYQAKTTILAVGDSFTFGFGVKDDEAFPALIGAHNAGMWGMSFNTQYKAFQRDIDLVHPKIVVWGIYPPHIISMMPGLWSENIPGDRTLLVAESTTLKKILAAIPFQNLDKSSLIKLLFKDLGIKQIRFDGAKLDLHRDGYQTKEAILFNRNISNTKYTDSEKINESLGKDREAVLQNMQEYFTGAKEIAERNKIKLLFFTIPSRLNLRLHDGTANMPSYENASIDPSLPATLVTSAIEKAGFSKADVLDLGELAQFQSGGWAKFYFKIDAHWNPEGHKLVAEALLEKLGLQRDSNYLGASD